MGHKIVKPGKSQDLQDKSASWKPRRADVIVSAWIWKLRRRPVSQLKDSQGKGKREKTRKGGRKRVQFSTFCGSPQLIGWIQPTLKRAMLITSRSMLKDTFRIRFKQIPRHHMAQSTWHIKITMIKVMGFSIYQVTRP